MASRGEGGGGGEGVYGGHGIFAKAALGQLVVGSPAVQLPWATGQGGVITPLFNFSEDPSQAVPFVVTLVPPASVGGSSPGYYGFEIFPQLGIFARIQWGSQASPAQIEVDFGQGVALPLYGSFCSVDAINESPIPYLGAPNATAAAFAAPGAFSLGLPKRTMQALLGGSPLSAANPLAPGVGSDLTPVAKFAQQLTVLISPFGIKFTATPVPFAVQYFASDAVTVVGSSSLLTTNPVVTLIPSDAKYVQLINLAPGGTNIVAARFVFGIGV